MVYFSCLLLSDRQYSSTMDLRKQVMTQKSFPGIDMVDHGHRAPQRFLSVPDIHISSEPQKSTKSRSGSKTKLGVSVEVLNSKYTYRIFAIKCQERLFKTRPCRLQ